jgi:hypothetical protein
VIRIVIIDVVVVGFAVAVIVLRFRSVERGIAVSGLPVRQRVAVWRSVWSGRAVRDPRLAAAAIELAHRLDRTEGRRERRYTTRWFRWPLAAGFILVGVLNLSFHSWFSGACYILLGGYWLCLGYSYRRAGRKRTASVAANQPSAT